MWGNHGGGRNQTNHGDPFAHMQNHMRSHMHAMDSMMNEMMGGGMLGGGDPFGAFGMLGGRPQRGMIQNGADPRSQMLAGQQRVADPFGMMMQPFGGGLLGGLLGQATMHPADAVDAVPGGGHVYSQCTTINFDSSGQPKVVHRTNEARKIGNAKEVRSTVRDMETGEERMTIGHHVGDRAHIIEKRRDSKGKQVREKERFVGIQKDDARKFDHEFASAARGHHHPSSSSGHRRELPALPHDLSTRPSVVIEEIPEPMHTNESQSRSHHSSSSSRRRYQQDLPNGPIITEPDSDEDEPHHGESKRGRSRLWHA